MDLKLCIFISLFVGSKCSIFGSLFHKLDESNRDIFKRNTYSVKCIDNHPLSEEDCLLNCICGAKQYSTLCGGITFWTNESHTLCRMLYPAVKNVPGLPVVSGANRSITESIDALYLRYSRIGMYLTKFR